MEKKAGNNALTGLMFVASASEYELVNKARAQKILDAWLADDEIDSEGGDEWVHRVNAVIAENMDAHSLHYFIKMIRISREKAVRTALARQGAYEKHREHRAMKAEVFLWLDVNRPKFKSMDSTAEAVTKQQPIAFRTARDWVGEWKKLRAASKP